jgi:hypothetical protein
MAMLCLALAGAENTAAQPLKLDPTAQDYVERNGGGSLVVPAGELTLDGHRMQCGKAATVLDPNLNDYGKSYPQFIILNMTSIAKLPTAVKLWIYNHECGHVLEGPDEVNADCFAIRRGHASGWLDNRGLEQVCSFISAARPDLSHVSGPDRCTLIRRCPSNSPKSAP